MIRFMASWARRIAGKRHGALSNFLAIDFGGTKAGVVERAGPMCRASKARVAPRVEGKGSAPASEER